MRGLFAAILIVSFPLGAADEVFRVGSGVTAPKLLSKSDPTYTKQAHDAYIQGDAMYSIVVDKNGRARDIEVISPLGFGLDENGKEAIQKWTFKPGMKNGQPVSVRAQVEVRFRFAGIPIDDRHEKRRSAFNVAVRDLTKSDRRESAVAEILRLAKEKYSPAMLVLGTWSLAGDNVPMNVAEGIDWIRKASDLDYGPAVYTLGVLYAQGQYLPVDAAKALKLVREAATMGSTHAQHDLGKSYLAGKGVEASQERARHYFRLCAAAGNVDCQAQLGELLIETPDRRSGDNIQALAWLQLAAANGTASAGPRAEQLLAIMTPQQIKMAEKLKAQLIRRPN